MPLTKEQVVNGGGKAVKIEMGSRTITGTIFPLDGQQITGYLSSGSEQAYIQVEGEANPRLYDLDVIDLVES